jgi:hypothetical protein
MSDFETIQSDENVFQEGCLSDGDDGNYGNHYADGEDDESGIGTLNEYDSVVYVERTEGEDSSSATRNWNESDLSQHSEGMNRDNVSTNFQPKASRRHTEGNLLDQSSKRNPGLRRHTFAGSRHNNIEDDDYQAKSTTPRLYEKRMKPEKDSINFEPKGSRRYTEGDIPHQMSSKNTGQRRHTFAGGRRKDIYENDHQPKIETSRSSSAEMKAQSSKTFEPKGSRRYTESDIPSQTVSRNAGERRHTFAGGRLYNIEEDGHQPESNTSRYPSAEMKRRKGSENVMPRGSRRHTEGEISSQTFSRNVGTRRHTFAGSKLDDIEEDEYETQNNTAKLSKSFSDTEIEVARDFNNRGDDLFRSQNSRITRRNTVAGDIVEELRELLGNTVDNNTSRFSEKRHTIADMRVRSNPDVLSEDDIRDPKTEDDDDVISTSEDEQNLKQVRGQYEAFKRHTIAGDGSEYGHGRTPSRNWFTSDEPDPKIDLDDGQLSRPKSAILKRHTIAGTGRDMNVLKDKGVRKSSQQINYSEDKRPARRTTSIDRESLDEPFKRNSISGQEYVRDVNLDKNEDIKMDRPLSLSRRHTIHADRQTDISKPQTKRRATHGGFLPKRELTLQDSVKDDQSGSRRQSSPVRRESTGGSVGVDELSSDYGHDDFGDGTKNTQSTYQHPFDSLHPRDNEEGENSQQGNTRRTKPNENYNDAYDDTSGGGRQIERYYVYGADVIDRQHDRRTPRNSSPYILSDNKLHVDEGDGLKNTNISVDEASPTYAIQTPGLTLTRSGNEHKKFVANQQARDSNTGGISSNYVALSSSIAPSPKNDDGDQLNSQIVPTRNILLRGQDERGNKIKFNLSVIEEEDGDEYYQELEMQSQETKGHHVSTNDLKTVTMTKSLAGESGLSKNATRLMENHEHMPRTSIVLSKDSVAVNDHGRNEIWMSRGVEPVPDQRCSCNATKTLKQQRCKLHTSVEPTAGIRKEKERQTEQQKENEKSEHDVISVAHKSVQSEETFSKSHRNTPDGQSYKQNGGSCLPCCSLHGKYQLHHPICCWHMTNEQCGECKVKQRRKVINELKETNNTIITETAESDIRSSDNSQESDSLVDEAVQTFSDYAQETKHLNEGKAHDICRKCGGGLEIVTGGNKTGETKPDKSIQAKVQDSRHQLDTSSERGDYKTAQESSISEDDFNDIKIYSDERSSSVHRKTGRRRPHRKSYKNKSRRKGSFERHRVCYVTL